MCICTEDTQTDTTIDTNSSLYKEAISIASIEDVNIRTLEIHTLLCALDKARYQSRLIRSDINYSIKQADKTDKILSILIVFIIFVGIVWLSYTYFFK
jgi:hypothetical protein